MKTRYSFLQKLAGYADPSWYQKIINWETERLEDLLRDYETKKENIKVASK